MPINIENKTYTYSTGQALENKVSATTATALKEVKKLVNDTLAIVGLSNNSHAYDAYLLSRGSDTLTEIIKQLEKENK
mgnify:CR=1 FL=1